MSNEIGSVRKDPGGKLNIALVYPNTYWVGMSNLGIHIMYKVLNDHPGIVCERFFLDKNRSVEASRPLSDFHLIAFSVSYELDWINVVKILLRNKIPIKSTQRAGQPIIIAGGPAISLNPEPMAEVFDVCFLGDGEGAADMLFDAFTSSESYEDFLDKLIGREGIYLPSHTYPQTLNNMIIKFNGPHPALYEINPIKEPAHTVIFSKETTFRDMFLLEIARGCPFRCKFCSAREIYHPFRPVNIANLTPILDQATASGLKLGLVSASLNNHPEAERLYEEIHKRGIKIAPPSLRLGMITQDLLELIRTSQIKGITVAPETGSETLRYAAGKNIDNQTILSDIHALVSSGILNVKLYFLIGLPGENLGHIDEMIDLIKRIRQTFIKVSKGNKRLGKLSVSINTMIPKPHTQYERQPMLNPAEAKQRIRRIMKGLQGTSNVTITHEGPKWAYLQTLFARGDRKVLDLIVELAKNEKSDYQEILRKWPHNPDFYTLRPIPDDEILPWSFYTHSQREDNLHA